MADKTALLHEQIHEQMQQWDRDLIRQINNAEVPGAVRVAAARCRQGGINILVARCPKCRTVAGIAANLLKSEEVGRHFCRGCNTLLEYVPEDVPMPVGK